MGALEGALHPARPRRRVLTAEEDAPFRRLGRRHPVRGLARLVVTPRAFDPGVFLPDLVLSAVELRIDLGEEALDDGLDVIDTVGRWLRLEIEAALVLHVCEEQTGVAVLHV